MKGNHFFISRLPTNQFLSSTYVCNAIRKREIKSFTLLKSPIDRKINGDNASTTNVSFQPLTKPVFINDRCFCSFLSNFQITDDEADHA
jgi:hypothetical protein